MVGISHHGDHAVRVATAANNLRIDAATAEVLRGLSAAGLQGIVLKGASIAPLLYDATETRGYLDCDLLIAPDSLDAAERVLADLGFRKAFDETSMPAWWREHANEWRRPADGVPVDLHTRLPGVGVEADVAWAELSADRETITIASQPASTLSLPARALHLALHATQHGTGTTQGIDDLERALARLDRTVWERAAHLAERLDATDAFSTGLRLVPTGEAMAAALELPHASSVEAALLASNPPLTALGFERLARARGVSARARIVLRKLIPPVAFMHHWDPSAKHRRFGLTRAYLRRPVWLLRNTPRGLRAWRHTRREARINRR